MKKLLYLLTFISSFAFAQTTVRMSATTSGVDTYSTLFNPNVAAFNSSTVYVIPFGSANTSGTITLDPDGGGPGAAVSIKGDDGNDLAVGAIKAGGTYQFKFNGTLLRMIGSSGSSGGWLVTGTTNLTGDVKVDGGTNELGFRTSSPGLMYHSVRSGTDSTYLYIDNDQFVIGDANNFIFTDPGVSMGWQSALPIAISGTTTVDLNVAGSTSQVLLTTDAAISANDDVLITANPTGSVHDVVITANAGTIHLDSDFLTINGSAGSSGNVLTSNGAGAAPTWQAPSGGGGATAAGATGNMQYKSAGGGLQAEADLTYDSAANILTIPNAKITGGSPGAGKLLQSDADGDASWVAASPIGSQDLFISAAAMWPRATDGSSFLTRLETGTSLFNIQSLDFDQTTQEFAQLQLVLPRNWNNGTITAVVYWTAASGSGTVQWGISGGAYSNDDALSVAFGTPQTTDDTLIATGDLHITPATSAITLAGTPADADFLGIQISRNPASDTLSGDAKLLGIRFTLTLDAAVSE